VHRQPTIAGEVPAENRRPQPKIYDPSPNFRPTVLLVGIYPPTCACRIAAARQGNYATFVNYLESQLRYMDAGE
jgi:hypothetical protein